MKTGDLLNTLAGKIGLQNDPNLIALLSNAEFAQAEVNDELANRMTGSLLSIEGAKNNADVMNHYKPILLKAMDDRFAIIAEELGIADQIAAEKSTYKQADIIRNAYAQKIADLEAKNKAKTTGTEETAKLTQQIADLQAQIGDMKTKSAKELADATAKHQSEILDMLISANLSSQNYANENVDKDINILTAKSLLQSKLAASKAILVNEGGVAKLKQADNPTLDWLDGDMKAVSFADYTNKMLADAKMLKVSAPQAQTNTPQNAPVISPAGATQSNADFASSIQSALGDLKGN